MDITQWLEYINFYMQLLELDLSYAVQCVLYEEREAIGDEISSVNNIQSITDILNQHNYSSVVYNVGKNEVFDTAYRVKSYDFRLENAYGGDICNRASERYYTAYNELNNADRMIYEGERLEIRGYSVCTDSLENCSSAVSRLDCMLSVGLTDKSYVGLYGFSEREAVVAERERKLAVINTAENRLGLISELSSASRCESCSRDGIFASESERNVYEMLIKSAESCERFNRLTDIVSEREKAELFCTSQHNSRLATELMTESNDTYIADSRLTELILSGGNGGNSGNGRGDVTVNVDFKAYATVNSDKEVEKLADIFVKRLEEELTSGSEGIHF